MSIETTIKVLEKSIELAVLLIELKKEERKEKVFSETLKTSENIINQFKGVPPIPDYKKGAKESIVLPNGEKITLSDRAKKIFNSGIELHFSDSLGYALNSLEFREKLFEQNKKYWEDALDRNENANKIIDHCIKVAKAQDALIPKYNPNCMKGNYEQPFAHPIENKEPKVDINEGELFVTKFMAVCPSCQHTSINLYFNLNKANITKCRNCFSTFKIVISDNHIKLLKV